MIEKTHKKIRNSTFFKESAGMFIAEGIGLFFALFIVLFHSRYLSVEDVGIISFVASLISFSSGFFIFGIDNTGARVIIYESDIEEKRKISGIVFLLSFAFLVLFGVFISCVSFLLPLFGKADMSLYIYMIIPFAGYNILLVTYKQLCYSLGRIKEASVQLCISYIVYFFVLVVAKYLGAFTIDFAIFASYAVNMLTVLLPIVFIHRKYLRWDKSSYKKIKFEQNERGWKIYFSRVIFTATSNIDTMIVGFFHPMDTVAFFSLSKYFAIPISMVGNSVSQSVYRKYELRDKISKVLLWKVIISSLLIAVGVSVAAFAVVFTMGSEYYAMFKILPLAIISNIISSINALYNSFMNAKGMANELKTMSVICAISKLIVYFALIIPFGAIGGITANLIIAIEILSFRIYYCSRYVSKLNLTNAIKQEK